MKVPNEEKERDENINESGGAAPAEAEESFSDYFSELLGLVGEMVARHGDTSVTVIDLSGRSSADDTPFDMYTEGVVVTANSRFKSGMFCVTNGGRGAMERSAQSPAEFLHRHLTGDWGELCDEDMEVNEQAVQRGGMILSHYRTARGERLYVHTPRDRTRTIIMTPEEW